jgi:hypothetical protein
MATTTPIVIRAVPRIMDDPELREQFRDGLIDAAPIVTIPDVDSEHPIYWAWDRAAEESIDELMPYFAAMLEAAIAKRLPVER